MSRKYFYHIFGLAIFLLSLSSHGEDGPRWSPCGPNAMCDPSIAYGHPQNPYQSQYNQPFTQPFQNPYPFQYNQPFAQPYNQPFVQPFQGWNPGGYPFYGVPPNR